MSYFKAGLLKPTVRVLERCIPEILINPNAIVKMQIYVDECNDEVGWLGTAYKSGNIIHIKDVFLFDQEVHATTTEITPEGLGTFCEKLMEQPDGMDIWNNMKVWGHSHVHMATSPSGQDDHQMEVFAESGHDWFIRIIANKKGDIRVDLYYYEQGIIYTTLPWEEIVSDEEHKIKKEIERLDDVLQSMGSKRLAHYEADIKAEIALKVKKKVYVYQPHKPTTVPAPYSHINNGGKTPITNGTDTALNDANEEVRKWNERYEKKTQRTRESQVERDEEIDLDNLITSQEDVLVYLDNDALIEIGKCISINEVEGELHRHGLSNYFNAHDLNFIWACGSDLFNIAFGRKV